MAHRINERNAGHSRLDGGAKQRPSNSLSIKGEQKQVVRKVLQTVFDAMQKDDLMNGDFTDGGRITLYLDRLDMTLLSEVLEKLNSHE